MLLECGFSDPVMDAELLTMTYAGFDQLLIDLRNSGSTCAMQARSHGLTGRAGMGQGRAAYARLAADDGRVPATVEVVYGHAWKAAPRKTPAGLSIVRFDPQQRMR
ncbi:hypothetical protein [Candidatus Accumulibacter sp. ACC012]|uniref:hypothetical protein n=1 Tax=Candidatus Accumulibacter sp. ACC012 TaxID=2823332 RepID=UPI0025BAEB6B|nr:hypothetical protein [Candidatus Accumulibacter sp. ACC012]